MAFGRARPRPSHTDFRDGLWGIDNVQRLNRGAGGPRIIQGQRSVGAPALDVAFVMHGLALGLRAQQHRLRRACAGAGAVADIGFHLAHLSPTVRGDVRAGLTHLALNYTFWLNLVFGALAAWLFWTNQDRKRVGNCVVTCSGYQHGGGAFAAIGPDH